MIKPLLDFSRRYIILFGTAKFAAGPVIGFALGVYLPPILTEEKGLMPPPLPSLRRAPSGAAPLPVISAAPTLFTKARERSGPAICVSSWRAKSRRNPITGCI